MLVEKHSTVLKIVLKDKATGTTFALYNVYEPYPERKGSWEFFFSLGIREPRDVILRGDLNLTLSEKENWRTLARPDGAHAHVRFFIYFLNLLLQYLNGILLNVCFLKCVF